MLPVLYMPYVPADFMFYGIVQGAQSQTALSALGLDMGTSRRLCLLVSKDYCVIQATVLGDQLLGVRAADGVVECSAAASTGLSQHGCCTSAHCWRCRRHGRLRCGACTLRITMK